MLNRPIRSFDDSSQKSAHSDGVLEGSRCSAANHAILASVNSSLDSIGSDYVVQTGSVDFGLMGDSSDADSCGSGSGGCYFSNPSSPYGMVTLPLAPREDLDTKLRANSTPPGVAESLSKYGGGR